MAKSGSGRPASPQASRGRHSPAFVPGVPGLPVRVTFRIREPRYALFGAVGLLAGLLSGVPVWHWGGWRFAVPVVLLGGLLGSVAGRLLPRDRCVERGCGAILARGAKQCPKCGGTIIGALAVGRGEGSEEGE